MLMVTLSAMTLAQEVYTRYEKLPDLEWVEVGPEPGHCVMKGRNFELNAFLYNFMEDTQMDIVHPDEEFLDKKSGVPAKVWYYTSTTGYDIQMTLFRDEPRSVIVQRVLNLELVEHEE
jgi:hypothetical protein